ncbi:MAG: hypothetical protein Tsb009_25860 [Planctomycetaceae bacterium]
MRMQWRRKRNADIATLTTFRLFSAHAGGTVFVAEQLIDRVSQFRRILACPNCLRLN